MSIVSAFFKAIVIPIGIGVAVMIIVQGIGFTIGKPDLLVESLAGVPELVVKATDLLDRCAKECFD